MFLDGQGLLFHQVYRAIRDAIVGGRFAVGSRLPPTRSLATELGVARATVLLAYDQLAAEGYLVGRRGSGSYVQGAAPAPAAPPAPLTSGERPRIGRLATALLERRRLPLESAYAAGREPLRWDFRYGLPSMADFPLATWRRCLGRCARRAGARAFDYGPPQGSPALRTALADYLGRSRGVHCTPEQIVIVGGSQQGIDLAARLLVDRGDRVVVEEPGFEGARNALVARGAALRPVAVDDEGLDPAALPRAGVRLVATTPSHQYPLGAVMSWTRRVALLAWARRTGAWILEDDYDGEFRFDGRPVPPLKALDAGEHVLYLGTLSKVMFPALRIGYLVLPAALVEAFARAKVLADGGGPRLEQEALAEFVASGAFERHVRRSRQRNGERRAALLDALGRHLGDRVVVRGANAGLHVVAWVPTMPGRAAGAFARRAAAAGVGIYPITPYYLTPPATAGFILGYSGLGLADIRAGVARLAGVFD